MLKKRIITAMVLIPLVILAILYLHPIVFSLSVLSIILIAAWEYLGLFNYSFKRRLDFVGAMMLIGVLLEAIRFIFPPTSSKAWFFILTYGRTLFILSMIGALWWLIAPYFLWSYTKKGRGCSINPTLLGVVMFLPCWASLVALRVFLTSEVFLLLSIVWATDIGAYFTGKFYGKHPLALKISPKKTIGGLVGGLLASLVTGIIGVVLLFPKGVLTPKRIIAYIMLSLIVSLWSVVGDLFESMLKRKKGVKDSGNLLPGHGGMYDRIDSLVAAAPILVVGLFIVNQLFFFK